MPTTTLPSGLQLYYELHGEGPPLLLIHGLGGSTEDYECQISYFKQQFTVIAFDLRGHGKSHKPNIPYTVALFAEDTAALLQTLAIAKAHIVGHSLGGMIAFQLVQDFPHFAQSLTVVNSAPAIISPNLKFQLSFWLRKWTIKLFGMRPLAVKLAKVLFPDPNQVKLQEACIQRLSANSPQAYLNSLNAFKNWNIMEGLNKINCPTLIVAAENDYTPVSFKQEYVQLIKHAELAVIPHSGHMTLLDQPAIFNETLMQFLIKHK